tara:strand:- start:655 stop:978 length:324 start_codon:yes stop_codon:yes gene_type:complete
MTNYKRSGFKMKGYSYPGTSPMTGKGKQADLVAEERRTSAPLKVVKEIIEEGTKSFGEELGEQAAKASVDAAVGLAGKGIESLVKGKKKTPKKTADQSNFANIKLGR